MNKLKKLKGLAHMCWPAAHCTGIDYSDEKPSALFVLAACCFLKCTVQHVFGIFCWFEFNFYRYCIEYMQPRLSSPHSPSQSPSLQFTAVNVHCLTINLIFCFNITEIILIFQQPNFSHLIYYLSAFSAK